MIDNRPPRDTVTVPTDIIEALYMPFGNHNLNKLFEKTHGALLKRLSDRARDEMTVSEMMFCQRFQGCQPFAGDRANYERSHRTTNTINYGTDLPLAQGVKFDVALKQA